MIEGLALHELVVDEQGTATEYRIISANAAFEKQLGLKREDAIGKLSRDAYRVDEPPYLDIYSRVTQSGTAEIFETSFQPLGKYFLISVYSPQTGQFATLFQDITRIRKAEAELKEREKSFRTIAENLPDIVVRFDRSLRTVFINESVELVTGLPRDSYIGKTLSEAGMPPELVEYLG